MKKHAAKVQNREKQKQKKALKDARRKATMQPKGKPKAPKSFLLEGRALDFWRAHGANYILSDYDTATWNPMFDIYDGIDTVLPSLNTAAQTVMDAYKDKGKEWPPEGRAALGWVVSSPETLTVYYMAAVRKMADAHPELIDNPECPPIGELVLDPHDATVWEVFAGLKNELAKRTA